MAESKNLNSTSKGSWVEEKKLTKGYSGEVDIDIYEKVIADYSRKIGVFNNNTDEKVFTTYWNKNYHFDKQANEIGQYESSPELIFPFVRASYDIFNSRKYYKKVQNWLGIVTEVYDSSFEARLEDLTCGGTDEIAEFEKEEVSPSDIDLLQPGAIFYWSAGRFMENGQIVNRSDIRFQRLITLNAEDIDETKRNIEKKYSNLKERKIDNSSAQ